MLKTNSQFSFSLKKSRNSSKAKVGITKSMGKKNRCGKSEVFSDDSYKRLKACLPSARDRLIVAIAFYTGERLGAVLQLETSMVYADARKAIALDAITFPAKTRKGKRDTRQLPIHDTLKEILQSYQPPVEGDWLFPSPRNIEEHLSFSAFDKMLRKALIRAGLGELGFSPHSFRRTFITKLHEKKVPIKVIQSITKHRSINSLAEYIDVSDEAVRNAVSLLPA